MKLKLKATKNGKSIHEFEMGDILECVTPEGVMNDGSPYMKMDDGEIIQITGKDAGMIYNPECELFIPAAVEVID